MAWGVKSGGSYCKDQSLYAYPSWWLTGTWSASGGGQMPRILPRLLQKIASQVSKPAFLKGSTIRPPNRKSLRRRLPVLPSFSSFGRKHSILLDPVNPILNRADYVQHKSLPPRVRVQKIPSDTFDNPRSMTTQERSWWSSPYRMHASHPYQFLMLSADA